MKHGSAAFFYALIFRPPHPHLTEIAAERSQKGSGVDSGRLAEDDARPPVLCFGPEEVSPLRGLKNGRKRDLKAMPFSTGLRLRLRAFAASRLGRATGWGRSFGF